jgi:hypothetical protein
MPLRTSGLPQNGFPVGEGPWIRRSRLEHARSCTGEIRSRKDLPDSPPVELVVYFPEIICFVRSWLTRAVTVLRRTTARLSLNQPTRARGGASGPGSPAAMAAEATQAGGLPRVEQAPTPGHRVSIRRNRPRSVARSRVSPRQEADLAPGQWCRAEVPALTWPRAGLSLMSRGWPPHPDTITQRYSGLPDHPATVGPRRADQAE